MFWTLIPSRTPPTDTFWLKKFSPVCSGICAGQKGLFRILAPNYFLLYPSVSVANLAFPKKKKEEKNVLNVPEGIYHPSKELNRKIRTLWTLGGLWAGERLNQRSPRCLGDDAQATPGRGCWPRLPPRLGNGEEPAFRVLPLKSPYPHPHVHLQQEGHCKTLKPIQQ